MNPNIQKYAPAITSLLTLVIYFLTMSRGVMPIDAGELAASQYTLGISHPSGYPLFNIIGFIWSKLPIGSIIFRLNLLCAIWVALANFFLVKTAFLILQNNLTKLQISKKPAGKNPVKEPVTVASSAILQLIASISGILILAFCRTWWLQSAGVEVYSLQVALIAIFLFLFLKIFYSPNPGNKDWILAGTFLGLCFTNHLTAVLLLPGILYLFFLKMKFTKATAKSGLILAGGFALVFCLLYGFMMVRAGSSPIVNYGNPNNMEYLQRHVTGWQFQSFMGADDQTSKSTVATFFQNFKDETAIVGLLLFIGGIIYGFLKNAKMGIFWGLNFVATLIYASQYDIHDIENYFLLAYMSAGIFMVFGIYWIFELAKGLQKNSKPAWAALLIPIIPLVMNYSKTDQSKLSFIDDYTIAALNSVEPNAVILTREWDVFVSPAYYYHLIEKMRPDVLILDKELLRRSWYHNQMKAWDPTFASKVEKQANEFKEVVMPFERKEKFNPNAIQIKFEAYISGILNEYKSRPVYVSSLVLDADIARGVDVKLPTGTLLIPDAYFYRVVPAADTAKYYPLTHPIEYNVNFTADKKTDKFQRMILNFSMSVLSARVGYEMGFGKKEEARKIVEIMQGIDPSIQMPQGL